MGLVYEDVADVGAVQPLLFLSTQPSRLLPQSDALPAFCVFRKLELLCSCWLPAPQLRDELMRPCFFFQRPA